MPPKSNNQKKKEAEAAGKPPKKTKQQENAGKSASQKKAEMQVRNWAKLQQNSAYRNYFYSYFQAKRAADREKKSGWWFTIALVNWVEMQTINYLLDDYSTSDA